MISSKAKELRAAMTTDILELMANRMGPVSVTLIEIICELIDEKIAIALKEQP